MNLVELIQNQLDGETVQILSDKIGAGNEQTLSAIQGAVPALLAGLSQVSKQPASAQALATAVDKVDGDVTDGLNDTLKNGLGNVAQQGSSLLAEVMAGGGVLSGISRAVSSFSGLSQGSTSSLMGVMGPLVLSNLKRQLGGDSSPAGISNLLASQQSNIVSAMPPDLNVKLSELSGLDLGTMLGGAAGLGTAGLGTAGLGTAGLSAANPNTADSSEVELDDLDADPNTTDPLLDSDDADASTRATTKAPEMPVGTVEGDLTTDLTTPAPAQPPRSAAPNTQTNDGSDVWRTVLMAIIAVLVVWLIINLIR